MNLQSRHGQLAKLAAVRNRSAATASALLMLLAAGLGLWTQQAQAAAFTYTAVAGASSLWSAGTNWTGGALTSGTDTTLVFSGSSNGNSTVTSMDNLGGPFKLNILTLNATNTTAATTATYNITPSSAAANTLNFTANGATAPVVNLNSAPSGTLNYIVGLNATIDGNLTFQGNGSAGFTFSGNLSDGVGSASIVKNNSSALTLSGSNSYTGATVINGGNLTFGAANSIGGSGKSVTVNFSGAAATGTGYAMNQAFLDRIADNSAGVVALGANSSNNLTLSTFANLSLGATNSSTYTGTLTPNGTVYRLGGGGGNLVFQPGAAFGGAGDRLVVGGSGSSGTVTLGTAGAYGGGTLVTSGPGGSASVLQTNLLTTAVPFGTTGGGISLNNGTLGLGTAGTLAASSTVNVSGYDVTFQGLGTIQMAKGTNAGTGVTFTANSLNRSSLGGVLYVNPSSAAAFSSSEKMLVTNNNSAGNVPLTVTNGMVAPYLIDGANKTFLTYGANGFADAATTTTFGANNVVSITSDPNAPLVAYALKTTVGLGANDNFTIGSGGFIAAGSLNNSAGTINFGNTPGYVGLFNTGNSAWQTVINGTAGVTFYGTGMGFTSAPNMNISGGLTFANGSWILQPQPTGNNQFQITNPNPLVLLRGATLTNAQSSPQTFASISGDGVLTSSNSGSIFNMTLNGLADTGTAVFSGIITNSNGGTLNLIKTGANTQVLTNANTYTGTTTLNGGTLKLDFSAADAPAANIINNTTNSSVLSLGGGTLALTGKASTSNSQRFNGLTVTGGLSAIQLNAAASNPLLLTLGAITRTGGALDFTLPTGSQDGTNGIVTTATNTNGILGFWATVGGTDLAAVSGSNIVAYTGYTDVTRLNGGTQVISSATGSNVRIIEGLSGSPANITLGSATTTINTLNQSAVSVASNATLDLTGKTLAVNSILVGTGAGALTFGTGTLRSANTELLINNSNTITVNALITNGTAASALNKVGSGLLVLAGANTYSGVTTVSTGTLRIDGTAGTLPGNVTNNAVLEFNRSNTYTYASAISGSGLLVQIGTGTLTLSGSNTYAGDTQVRNGKLILNNTYALQNSTLDYNSYGGTVELSSTVAGKAFTFGGLKGSQDLALQNNAAAAVTLTVGGNNASTSYTGTLSAAGSLTKAGSGTLTLADANSYTGITTINAGVLSVASLADGGNASGIGAAGNAAANLVLGGGTLQYTGTTIAIDRAFTLTNATTGAFDVTVATTTLTLSGAAASTSGGLTKAGAGTLVLSGANAYTGATRVNDGILRAAVATVTGVSSAFGKNSAVTLSGLPTAGLDLANYDAYLGSLTGGGPTGGNITMGTANLTVGSDNTGPASYGGTISGSGAITKIGTGTLSFSGSNSYTGGITLTSGQLSLSNANALSTGTLTINGGTLYNGAALTLATNNPMVWNGSFSSNRPISSNFDMGSGAVTMNNNITISLDANAYDSLFIVRGNISDNGNNYALTVNKGGSLNPGRLVLTGSNSYNGGTVLNSAGLRIGSAYALGTGTLTINGGGLNSSYAGALMGVPRIVVAGDFGINNGGQGLNLGTIPVSVIGARAISIDNGGATINGIVSGTGASIAYNGTAYSNSLTLGGENTFDGGIALKPGGNALTLNFGNLGTSTAASAIGTGTLTMAAGGSSTLRIDNSSGNDGTLATNNPQAWNYDFTFLGSKALNMGTGAVTLGGSRIITSSGSMLTIAGAIGDGGNGYSLTKAGNGTLALTNSNSYGGNTNLNAGVLLINNASALSTGTLTAAAAAHLGNSSGAAITVNNILKTQGDIYFDGPNDLTFATGTTTMSKGSNIMIYSNTGNLIFNSVVTATDTIISGGTGTVTLNNANLFNTSFTASAGKLNLNNAGALGTATFAYSGGTFGNTSGSSVTLNNNPQVWNGNLVFAGPNDLNLGTGTVALTGTAARTVTVNAGTLTVGGIISSTGVGAGLTKAGVGTLVLAGNNTYSGTTTVSAGNLVFSSMSAITGTATRPVLVNAGGAVVLQGATDPTSMLSKIVQSSAGAIALDVNSSANLNFLTPGLTAASLGAVGNVTYSGVMTPWTGTYRFGGGGGTLTVSSNLTGANRVEITGTSKVVLTGSNSYTGLVTNVGVAATLQGSDSTAYSGDHALIPVFSNTMVGMANTSTLELRANGSNDSTSQVLTFGNQVQNSNSAGAFTIDVNQQAATGGTNKTLAMGSMNLGANETLNVTGGNDFRLKINQLNLGGGASTSTTVMNPTTGNLTITSVGGGSNTASPLLKLDGTSTDNWITGVIANNTSGATSILKSNSSTWTLAGNNTYTGSTLVSGGTLKASSTSAFGTGVITVSGGVLDLTATNVANVINITGTNASVRLQASAGALNSNFAAGSNFRGWQRNSGLGNSTLAQLLGGQH